MVLNWRTAFVFLQRLSEGITACEQNTDGDINLEVELIWKPVHRRTGFPNGSLERQVCLEFNVLSPKDWGIVKISIF